MISSHYAGMQLVDIEEEAFSYGFDPEERFPALVLASCESVPSDVTGGWRLAYEDCGGYSCDIFYAAVLPLAIRPEITKVLQDIVDECFTSEGLGYLTMMSEQERIEIREAYLAILRGAGLSCDQTKLKLLTQALYPVDATMANLAILSNDQIDPAQLQVSEERVIFIVGENCD